MKKKYSIRWKVDLSKDSIKQVYKEKLDQLIYQIVRKFTTPIKTRNIKEQLLDQYSVCISIYKIHRIL